MKLRRKCVAAEVCFFLLFVWKINERKNMRPTLRPGAELECRLTGRKMHDYQEWNRGGGKLTLVYFSVAIFFICGGYFVCFVVSDDGSFGRLEWMDGWFVGSLVAWLPHQNI